MKPSRYVMIVLLQAFVLFVQGQTNQTNTDSLLSIVREDRKDIEGARALNALAFTVARTDLQKAKSYLLQSVAISRNGNFTLPLSNAYVQLTERYQDIGLGDSAF